MSTLQNNLQTYIEAKGFMLRKPYIIIMVSLMVFTILTQLAGLQQLENAGVDLSTAENIAMPMWVNIVLLITYLAAFPALIMRVRDAGLPTKILGGIYALNILLAAVQMITGIILPSTITGIVSLMTFVIILAMMFRPSAAS